jgi:hypothetical protein
MTATNAIRIALENHLNTTSPTLPVIAWPNVPFVPAPGTTYLRAQFVPLTRRPVTAGPNPEQRLSGQFFVTVYTPEENGADEGMLIADRLLTRFNGSSAILTSSVSVRLAYSEVKMPLHDPPFFVIPVEIGWYAYKRSGV